MRLLAYDDARWAMLLERCEPGTLLATTDAEGVLDVFVELLPRLWQQAGAPFMRLADEARWWIDYLPGEWERAGRPFGQDILDAAIERLRALVDTQGEQVLLHQDLHADNVIAAEREPWLAIDPEAARGRAGILGRADRA